MSANDNSTPVAVNDHGIPIPGSAAYFPVPRYKTYDFSVQSLAGGNHAMCINLLSQVMDRFSHQLTESERRGVAAWFAAIYGGAP